jgi:hypothetical protein
MGVSAWRCSAKWFFWSIVVVYVLFLWFGDSKDYLHEAVRTLLFLVSLAAALILDKQDAISRQLTELKKNRA